MDGTLVYREYDAQIDDRCVTVAITLAQPVSDSRIGGCIFLLEAATPPLPPMTWSFDGTELGISATSRHAETLVPQLRGAIDAFVLHFLESIVQEIDAGPQRATALH